MRSAVTEIRLATVDDLIGVVDLAWRFLKFAPFGGVAGASRDSIGNALRDLIGGKGAVWIAVVDEAPVGLLAATIGNPWFAPQTKLAVELGWWVDPEHRGLGLRLLHQFEEWADLHDVAAVVLSDMTQAGVPMLGDKLERLGYQVVERTHLKERN